MLETTHTAWWIGVDLDGTLAKHYWPKDGPYEHDRIGDPIEPMVRRIKAWLERGFWVKIFTARVGPSVPLRTADETRLAIKKWCREHLGTEVDITASKDYAMRALFDDRAVTVEQDTGLILTFGYEELT